MTIRSHAQDSTTTLAPPRFGFAAFSISVALFLMSGYALVTISNGEGQGFIYYARGALVLFPLVLLFALQASCRVAAKHHMVLKHDLFTTRWIPISSIEAFNGDNGLSVHLRDGRELEFWGHGSSLIGELFQFDRSYRQAYKINMWLASAQERLTAETSGQPASYLTLRADFVRVLVACSVIVLACVSVVYVVADDLRPIVNSPDFLPFL